MNDTWMALILVVFTSGQVEPPENWSIYHHYGYRMTEGPLRALAPEISQHRGATWK